MGQVKSPGLIQMSPDDDLLSVIARGRRDDQLRLDKVHLCGEDKSRWNNFARANQI